VRVVLRKNLGAFPEAARPSIEWISFDELAARYSYVQIAREAVYKSLDEADHAEVSKQALIICFAGRSGISG